ncbi:MAG: mannonate dehydratase [Clostridia bacterium]|nr:mannonate dehydratase [Clostridia bacterium]
MNPNHPSCAIKLCNVVSPHADDGEIRFLQQLGVRYAYTWCPDLSAHYDDMARLRDRLASHGITLNNIGDYYVCKSPNIHLGTPERDRDIEKFFDMMKTIHRLGVHVTTFTWEPDQVWTTSFDYPTRGGALTRHVDLEQLKQTPPKHGRVYEKPELWEHFSYFMRQVIPEAESMDIRLALHPNDPPTDRLGGVDCLIASVEDFCTAFRIADSRALGMEFCCGCWLEGGKERFGDIFQSIREFVAQDRVLIVHFRNVSGSLPVFTETFIDDGDADMFALMQAFCRAGYSGTLIYDHSPVFGGNPLYNNDRSRETAYAVGYIKALMNAASRNH